MKGKKVFAAGIALGMAGTLTVSVFAQPLVERITAYIRDDFQFVINGEEVAVPEDSHILSYEGRSYLPARFLAEQLGAQVQWDEEGKIVNITLEDQETPQVPDEEDPQDQTQYQALPVMKYTSDYEITVKMYGKDSKGDRIWVVLKNKQDAPVQLDQIATKITADGVDYKINTSQASDFDKRWYNDIGKDQEVEGFILLPVSIQDPEKLDLTLFIRQTSQVSGTSSTHQETFHIALK